VSVSRVFVGRGPPFCSEDCLQGPAYRVVDGLRWVEPYLSVFSSTVSARTHPGVDISILEYLGKLSSLPVAPNLIRLYGDVPVQL
jgi:hypothetical protein